VPIPMSSDNYCYLVIDEVDKTGVLIDAADVDAVQVSSSDVKPDKIRILSGFTSL